MIEVPECVSDKFIMASIADELVQKCRDMLSEVEPWAEDNIGPRCEEISEVTKILDEVNRMRVIEGGDQRGH